jgi:hypothetical protein
MWSQRTDMNRRERQFGEQVTVTVRYVTRTALITHVITPVFRCVTLRYGPGAHITRNAKQLELPAGRPRPPPPRPPKAL